MAAGPLRHHAAGSDFVRFVRLRVELCYVESHRKQVRITGVADTVHDQRVLRDLWNSNPLLRDNLDSIDNPKLLVYRAAPNCVSHTQEWAWNIAVPLDGSLKMQPVVKSRPG